MSEPALPKHFLQHFVKSTVNELSQDNLSTVLTKAGLPSDWSAPSRWEDFEGLAAAETYAGIQKAIRTYYGRGARGTLLRVGSGLWKRLLENASLVVKTKSKIIQGLPVNARRKPTLDLLANLIGAQRGDVSVHTLDLDLLLSDKSSPGTLEQTETGPICFVTLGLLQESLYWSTGQEHDIEENSCRANGENACEFKITVSGELL
ncbi:MAG: hypothetical protein QGM50_02280 [Anaerolineae bacterium]|nr:hypothetical protein [Anaerolineae bacterium]MDK1080609.1 hypothetical protein [Anaerolineae bacterium]MDK1117597.1 hypothetical protein [Anaerolineae bacterium]